MLIIIIILYFFVFIISPPTGLLMVCFDIATRVYVSKRSAKEAEKKLEELK